MSLQRNAVTAFSIAQFLPMLASTIRTLCESCIFEFSLIFYKCAIRVSNSSTYLHISLPLYFFEYADVNVEILVVARLQAYCLSSCSIIFFRSLINAQSRKALSPNAATIIAAAVLFTLHNSMVQDVSNILFLVMLFPLESSTYCSLHSNVYWISGFLNPRHQPSSVIPLGWAHKLRSWTVLQSIIARRNKLSQVEHLSNRLSLDPNNIFVYRIESTVHYILENRRT